MNISTAKSRSAFAFARYHVPNLARALRVLEFLAAKPEGCGVTEIASQLKIPVNSAFRVAATLFDHGYLLRNDGTSTYRLSRKLLSLGYQAIDEAGLVETSLDVLRHLRDETGETAMLAVLAHQEGIVIEQVPARHPFRVTVQVGHRFPMHSSAPGKALLAFLPGAERHETLKHLRLARFTAKTITTRLKLERELDAVRRRGYAVDRGEEVDGLCCVGAPVLNHRGHPLAAIWVTGPAQRLGEPDFDRVGAIVKKHALTLSRRLG